MSSKFYKEIKDSKIEKEVESVYKKGISIYFDNTVIKHPYGCDGYIEYKITDGKVTKALKLLMEFKFDENFNSKTYRCKVLIQVLYYIKRFELDGAPLPNVVLIGDKDECFVIHTNDFMSYLDEDIDWNIAPSDAPDKNRELLLKLTKDEKINPFIFVVDEHFSFQDVATNINNLALNIQRFVRVTEHNISNIYDYFISKVIKNPTNFNANFLVSIFIDLMIAPKDNYKHPSKKHTLVLSTGEQIQINGTAYDSFFNYFERKYTPREKEKFTEIADRLIEDTNRRFKGEFYTPTLWVDEAHNMISTQLGSDWKDKYTVWDCAWGTGNLTRDYSFRELYCSTLNEGDLVIGNRYNISAEKFQYDFLNDDIELLEDKDILESNYKMPKSLLNVFKNNKPILFLINPPYGTANNRGNIEGDHKEGIAITGVNTIMKKDNIGACSQQLYAQFLYRILKLKKKYNLSNVSICIFAKSTYMTGGSFVKFRESFLKEFKYLDGMLFQASHFADVKGVWGVDFSVWSTGETIDKNQFSHELKDINEENQIVTTNYKNIYNLDKKETCSDWIKSDVKGLKTYDAPQMSNALIIKPKGRGKLVPNALGYYVNVSNTVYENGGNVFLVSSCAAKANGISILPSNFMKVVSNFAARKLITGKFANWINDKDEYLIPNIHNEKYEEWNNDCIIYSIFNTSSIQSSLRNVIYADRKWNLKNEFFFMSSIEIADLANEFNNDDVYMDIKNFGGDRYVYTILNNIELSPEATILLTKAKELIKKSFKYRELFNDENPEFNINTWDAGWYQIKALLNQYMKDELSEFNLLYKSLENKLRPWVYELGFLIN